MQDVMDQTVMIGAKTAEAEVSLGTRIGLVGKLFGCWHKRLSRPFTQNGGRKVSYRACLECGARRKFDTDSFKTSGPFYYPPKARPDTVRDMS